MIKLLEKLNSTNDNLYDFLKLSSIDVSVRGQSAVFNFIYPENKKSILAVQSPKIIGELNKILKCACKVEYKFKQSLFDDDDFKIKLKEFLSDYPYLSIAYDGDKMDIVKTGDKISIILWLPDSVSQYCSDTDILTKMEKYFDRIYCNRISISIESYETQDVTEIYVRKEVVEELEHSDGRYIIPQNVEDFIGNIVYDRASYIEDATKPTDYIVLCGTVNNFTEKLRKQKEDEIGEQKKFYKFTLEDFTGKIDCIYFPSKRTKDQITLLNDGSRIVARGKLTVDTFNNRTATTFNLREISLCTLPENFVVNRIKRKVADEYLKIFPVPYNSNQQGSLFEEVKYIAPKLRDKVYCVVDIETTGLNASMDKIIEIGAVKIVNGEIKETFSSMIDPLMHIPERITNLTTITDADCLGQPKIEEVLPDFYKFSYGTSIVGHNVQFDFSFIEINSKAVNIYYDCELLDTFSMGKSLVQGLANYKLGSLLKHFEIKNQGAHRAIYDAMATAELFIKLINLSN